MINPFKSKISETQLSLDNLQESFDNLNEDYSKATNEVISLTEQLATINSEFTRVSEENKNLLEQIEALKVENVEIAVEAIEINELAAEKAVDILASIGTEPVAIAEAIQDSDLMDEMKNLKGQELVEFYNKHKAEIANKFKR